MKNILVPTDFSDCAHGACDYAIQLSAKAKADLHFLHLQDTPVDWVRLSKEKESQYPETLHEIGVAKSKLRDLVDRAIKNDVKADKTIIYSVGQEVVLNHLKNRDYDFMVMGSHGAKGIKEKFIGSNAQHMIRHSTVPVLVIKNPIEREIKNILFASDFSDLTPEAFSTLLRFSDTIGAHIDLLYVNTPGKKAKTSDAESNMNKLLDAFPKRKSEIRTNQIDAQSVETGIQSFANDNDIDLVAIATHGKSVIKQMFSPSIAEAVANHSHLPILSFHI